MTDHDTDLTDPHGEAEALRRENERLRAERDRFEAALVRIAEGNLGDAPWQANYARIREVAATALAATLAPDPVVNAGSCQPGDLISRSAAVEAVTLADKACLGAMGAREAIRAIPAAPVAEAQPTIGGAELDALVERLRKLARDMEKDATDDWDEHEDVAAAADAITALRAQSTPVVGEVKG